MAYRPNMTLQEIMDEASNIANSMYNLRKNGQLDHITDEEYKTMRKAVIRFADDIAWTILYRNKK